MIKSLTLISLLRVILSIMMTRLKGGSSILDANNNSTLTATTSIANNRKETSTVSPPLLCRGDVISNMIFAKGSSLETYTRSSGALYYPSSFSDNNIITTESNDSVLKFPSINSCCSSSLSSSCTCSCCLNPQQQPTLGGERLCGILEGGIVGSSSFVGGVPHHNNYHRSVSPLNDLWWKQGLPPCLVEEEHTLSTVGKGPWEAYSMTTNDCAGEEPMMMVDTGSQASSRSHVSVPDLRFPSTYICSDASAVGVGVVRRRRPSPFDSSDEQRDTNNNSTSNGDNRHMMMMTISPSSSSLIMSHHHPDDVDCCFCCDEPILFRQVESLLCSSWKSPVVPNHQLFMSNLMSSSFNDAIHLRCLAQAIFCVYKYFVQKQQQTATAALPDQQQPFKFKSSMQRSTTLPGWETADWNDFQILDNNNEDQQQQIDQPANCPVEEAMKKTLPGPNSSVPKAVLLVMIFIYRIHQTTVAERTTCFNSHSPGNHYAKHSANNTKRLSFRECFSLLVASMCFEKRIQFPVSAFHAPPSTPVSTTSKQGPSTSPSSIQTPPQPCTPKELSKRLPQILQESRIPSNTYKSLSHAKPHSDTPPPTSHAPPELPPSSRSFTVHQLPQQSARDDATAFDKKCKSSSDAASTNSTRSRTTRRLTNICFKLIPEKIKRVDKHFTNNVTRVTKRQDPGTEGVTSTPQENSASQNNNNSNAEQDVATVGPSAESALLKGFSTGLSRHNASISTTLKSLPLNFLWQMNSNNPEGSPANNLVKVASGSLLSGWSFGVLGVKRMGRSLIVRDCGLALEILSRFCQNLFVVWSWIDDETHISTGSIGRLIRTAGLILAKARVCASPANSADESSPTSVVCDPMSAKNNRSMRGMNESSFLTPPYHRKGCETEGGGLLLNHYSPSTHTSGTASQSVQSTSGMNYLDSSRTSSTRATTTSSYAPSMSSPNTRGNGSRLLFPSSWNNTHNRLQGSNTNNGISTTSSTSDNPSSNNSGLFNRNALKKLQESASGLHLSIPCANNNSLALSQTHDCPLCHTSRQLGMAGTTSTMNTPPSTNSLLLLTQSSDFSTCCLETEIFNMMNRVEYGLGLEADQFTRMSDKVWNSLKTERAH